VARLLQTYVIPFELSATRKLGQCVLRRIISRTVTQTQDFFRNRDIDFHQIVTLSAGSPSPSMRAISPTLTSYSRSVEDRPCPAEG